MFVNAKYTELAKKRDKLLPRERINAILDKGSPFLEMSQLAGYKVNQGVESVQHGNVLSGVGLVNGRHCMVIANNHAFAAGSYYPITVKKHLRA